MSDPVGDAASLKYLERTTLDESLYHLDADQLRFFQVTTNIADPGEIKQHILAIQSEAFRIFPYPCIRYFMFTKLKVARYPIYAHVLEYGRTHADAIFLDMACCFGNDARKAALDGYPLENIVATDLRRDFWDQGFKLFKDDPTLFPVPFLEGDIFSMQLLNLDAPRSIERPKVPQLKSLTELLGHVSIIHASAFFHLFSEDDQKNIAERCVALLSVEPGSTIFGSHNGAPEPGVYTGIGAPDREMFCHSPESWRELWIGLFGERKINVIATLEHNEAGAQFVGPSLLERKKYAMIWSVTVL
ncbi:hypothetical protein RSOLAG1IB_07696 [Rhizoctonia solani AG-1 IB]|uniref:Methyltransferase domain-containing protein n=1 Tax=Thanatephorus cucumeris (strain AG1-IB / isolate 7/3/14) TaxID=1108050 RepID=A0A0B7FF80_THACB|nr:hypothetical protein RSOLAG1IB_07696 [Rhizoctonia solani AG-1 IB]